MLSSSICLCLVFSILGCVLPLQEVDLHKSRQTFSVLCCPCLCRFLSLPSPPTPSRTMPSLHLPHAFHTLRVLHVFYTLLVGMTLNNLLRHLLPHGGGHQHLQPRLSPSQAVPSGRLPVLLLALLVQLRVLLHSPPVALAPCSRQALHVARAPPWKTTQQHQQQPVRWEIPALWVDGYT